VLIIDGKVELIVQNVKSCQRLLDLAERLETVQAINKVLASVERGEGRLLEDVFDDLEKEMRKNVRT
jgi:hypothetical protein